MSARGGRREAASILIGVFALVLAGACSHGPVPPAKDPAQSQFYSNEEIARLGKSARDCYCKAMDTTLTSLKDETKRLQTTYDSLSTVADTVRNRSVSVASQTRELATTLRDLRLKDKAINSYAVKKGETLRKIAGTVYGDPTRWREIYEANKGAIGPEDAHLQEGLRLTIPKKDSGTGTAAPGKVAAPAGSEKK